MFKYNHWVYLSILILSVFSTHSFANAVEKTVRIEVVNLKQNFIVTDDDELITFKHPLRIKHLKGHTLFSNSLKRGQTVVLKVTKKSGELYTQDITIVN